MIKLNEKINTYILGKKLVNEIHRKGMPKSIINYQNRLLFSHKYIIWVKV